MRRRIWRKLKRGGTGRGRASKKFYSAPKQDQLGPILKFKNTLLAFFILVYTLFSRNGSVDYGDNLCAIPATAF